MQSSPSAERRAKPLISIRSCNTFSKENCPLNLAHGRRTELAESGRVVHNLLSDRQPQLLQSGASNKPRVSKIPILLFGGGKDLGLYLGSTLALSRSALLTGSKA